MSEEKISPEGSSLERLIPNELNPEEATGSETLRFHLDRYEFAKGNLIPGTVLDIACGVGYGTVVLAGSPGTVKVVGVDISEEAIAYAKQNYMNERVSYVCSSAHEYKSEKLFDNIVSLETIEHLDRPREFFSHLIFLLRPGGRLIASAPVTPSVDANPHHKSNFSTRTLTQLGADHALTCIASLAQTQRYDPFAIAARREKRAADVRRNIALFYLRNPTHLGLRLWSVARDGFVNKYLTVVWEKLP